MHEDGQSVSKTETGLRRVIRVAGHESSCTIDAPSDADDLTGWWRAYLEGRRPKSDSPSGRTLKTMDLFSGVGGLALGFRQAAEECGFSAKSVVAIDQDADALSVYRANHRTDVVLAESTSMLVNFQLSGTGDDARFYGPPTVAAKLAHLSGSIDAILAGPPCQGHSNLNNYSRRDDERNDLYLTVPAMAVALQVPIVIIENVPGVVHDHRSVVSTTIALLQSNGYSVTSGVHDAAAMGWPQTRKRFFVVASRDHDVVDLDVVAAALRRPEPLPITWALADLPIGGDSSFMDELSTLSADNQRRVEYLFANGVHELPNDQRPDCHQDGTSYRSVYGRMHADKPSPTITAGFLSPGRGRFTHPLEPRALSPREAARIQAFPDDYCFSIKSAAPGRTHLARWIGNAVPMPLGYAAALSALAPMIRQHGAAMNTSNHASS